MSVQKIPKIIHYCWFGGKTIPAKTQKYIESWQKACPDYKIMRWDESSFDVDKYSYTSEAYAKQKWAFVSDVCRLEKVLEYGGIYIDVNTQVLRSFDEFLEQRMFVGFEQDNHLQMGIFGAVKNHPVVRDLLNKYYRNAHLVLDDGSLNPQTINNRLQRELLERGLRPQNKHQKLADVRVYPKEYFCPLYWNSSKSDPITDNTVTVHYYGASWYGDEEKKELKKKIARHDKKQTISVVVPVYNVANYLDDCLQSLIEQAYSDTEIILVNDGSTDRSGQVCKAWQNKHPDIKLINQDNMGLNMARRSGFMAASGDLIAFVDSDDVLAPEYLQTLRSAMDETGSDISAGGFSTFKDANSLNYKLPADGGAGEIVHKKDPRTLQNWLIIGGAPWTDGMHIMTVWGKLYRRELVEKIDWELSNFRSNEDEPWTMQAFKLAKNGVVISPSRLYGYRINEKSITRSRYKNEYRGEPLNKFEYIEALYRLSLKYLGDSYNGPLLMRYARQTLTYLDEYAANGTLTPEDLHSVDRHLPEKVGTMRALDIPKSNLFKLRFIAKFGARAYILLRKPLGLLV